MFSSWVVPGRLRSRNFLEMTIVAAIFLLSYLWKLSNLTIGASGNEISAIRINSGLHHIWHTPLNAPYYLVLRLLLMLHVSAITAGRLTSVLFMAIFSICLYLVLSAWFGKATAIFGTILFITNPLSLTIGRSAGPAVMMFYPAAILAVFSLVLSASQRLAAVWLATCLVVAFGLYVPGLLWLLLAGLTVTWRPIFSRLKRLPKKVIYLGPVVALITLLPLLRALTTGELSWATYLLIPSYWGSVVGLVKSFGWSISALVVESPRHTVFLLGRLPLLNISQLALLVFGAYAVATRLLRTAYMVLAVLTVVLLLAGINRDTSLLAFGLPLFSMLAAVGIRFLYVEWRSIFPLNPLPKFLAIGLITVVLALNAVYGIRTSLVAWPHSSSTKKAYVLK